MNKPDPLLRLHMQNTTHGDRPIVFTNERTLYWTVWYSGCVVLIILIVALAAFAAGVTWERHHAKRPSHSQR